MAFTATDRRTLLQVRGVGPTVIRRLEEIGIDSMGRLARMDADSICRQVAAHLRATCWANSPQARAAIEGAIAAAREADRAPRHDG